MMKMISKKAIEEFEYANNQLITILDIFQGSQVNDENAELLIQTLDIYDQQIDRLLEMANGI